jgi:hypothetical protein
MFSLSSLLGTVLMHHKLLTIILLNFILIYYMLTIQRYFILIIPYMHTVYLKITISEKEKNIPRELESSNLA